jgi:chemotaxis methyl-accepting protein methylase
MLRRLGALARSRLLGSDVSAGRVELARRGAMVSAMVRREARPVLRWERRDLLREPPPPGAFNLVLCRNVTIYFEPAAQRTVYVKLAAALGPGGILMLGTSERLLGPGRFGLAEAGPHLYRRVAA